MTTSYKNYEYRVKNKKPTQEFEKFFRKVICSFHIEQGDFENNLHLGYVYELLLYQWIYGSYQKGKSVEETIRFIFRLRNQILLTSK